MSYNILGKASLLLAIEQKNQTIYDFYNKLLYLQLAGIFKSCLYQCHGSRIFKLNMHSYETPLFSTAIYLFSG